MEGTGVLIQEIDPGVVNTEMTKVPISFKPEYTNKPIQLMYALEGV